MVHLSPRVLLLPPFVLATLGSVCESTQNCDNVYVDGCRGMRHSDRDAVMLTVDFSKIEVVKSMSSKLRCLHVFTPQRLLANVSSHLKQMRNKATVFVELMDSQQDVIITCPHELVSSVHNAGKSNLKQNQHCHHGSLRFAYVPLFINVQVRGGGKIVGSDVTVWDILSKKYGFNMSTIHAKSYSNMIRMLGLGSADVGIGQPTFAYQRHQLADESVYITMAKLGFMSRTAMPVDSLYTLIYPFHKLVWLAVIASFVCIMATLLALLRSGDRYTGMFPLFELMCSLYGIEGMPNKSFDYCRSMKNMNYLHLLVVWLLSGMFLAFSYQSVLLAGLVKVQQDNPVDTWKELLNSDANIYVLKNSIFDLLMKHSPDHNVREVYAKKKIEAHFADLLAPSFFSEVVAGKLTSVLGDAGIHGHRHYAAFSKDTLLEGYSGFYFAFHAPLKDELNSALLWMHQFGVIKKVKQRWLWLIERAERNFYRKERKKLTTPLSFRHFSALWIITGVGLTVSLVVAAYEFLMSPGWFRH